jgi:hypothetical protein
MAALPNHRLATQLRQAARDREFGLQLLSATTAAYWASAAYAGYWSRPYGYDGYYGWH